MDFGEVLTRAWKIIWKYKVLWIFGILAGCGQGGGGGGGGGSNVSYQFSGDESYFPPEFERFFFDMERFFDNIEPWHIMLFVAGMLLFFFILWAIMTALSTVGKIGLIQGTQQAEAEIEPETMSFGELFRSGTPFFWRILGLNLGFGLAIFLLVMILIVPLALVTVFTLGLGLICIIPLVCILIPVGWLVGVVLEQANIAIVVEDLGIIEGLQRGWNVFRENLGTMIVMGLILGIGGAIVGLIFALPMIMVVVPLMIGIMTSLAMESEVALGSGVITSGICCVAYLPVLIVLSGILKAYIESAWTLTYLRLTTGSPEPEPMPEALPEELPEEL
jgi:hypothetical protein